MTLPPKALNVLASLKSRLIEQGTPEANPPMLVSATTEDLNKPLANSVVFVDREHGPTMRHAHERGGAFQRMCRRRDWASPVY